MSRIVPEIIRTHNGIPSAELPPKIEGYLSRLNVTSTYWPGDAEIRERLRAEQVFRRVKKARLRMLLEAIGDSRRRGTNQPQLATAPRGRQPRARRLVHVDVRNPAR